MTSKEQTTRIAGGTIVAFRDGAHCILKDDEVVFRGTDIVHVGRGLLGLALALGLGFPGIFV